MTTILPQYTLDDLKHKILDLQNRNVVTSATKSKVARDDFEFALSVVMRLFEVTNKLTTDIMQARDTVLERERQIKLLNLDLEGIRLRHPIDKKPWDRAIEIIRLMFPNQDRPIVGIKDPEKLFERHLFEVAVAREVEASSMQALWSYSFTTEAQRPCVRWLLAVMTSTETPTSVGPAPVTPEDFRACASACVRFRNLYWPIEIGRMVYYGWTHETVKRLMDAIANVAKAADGQLT